MCVVLGRSPHWRADSDDEYGRVLLHQARSFYGAVSVKERRYPRNPAENHRVFYSGQITHGIHYQDPDKRRLPVTYYGEDSGVGETLNYAKSRNSSIRVAVIGLGAGTPPPMLVNLIIMTFMKLIPKCCRWPISGLTIFPNAFPELGKASSVMLA